MDHGYRIEFIYRRPGREEKHHIGGDVFRSPAEAIEQLTLTEDWLSLMGAFGSNAEFSILIRPDRESRWLTPQDKLRNALEAAQRLEAYLRELQ